MFIVKAALLPGIVLAALALAPPAGASAPGNTAHQVVIGNFVGDRIADRATLGFDAAGCTVTVQRGKPHGAFAAGVVHHYTIPGLSNPAWCPDMGVALHRGHGRTDDLAVTWFVLPPGPTAKIYVLRHLQLIQSGPGETFPSRIGSQDFNGDGAADIWETTDQGEGFQTFLRSGHTFVPGPARFSTRSPNADMAFGNLDGVAGTDIAAAFATAGPGSTLQGTGVLVMFGATGQQVVLEIDPTLRTTYTVSLLDADHDCHLDVRVGGGDLPPRTYLNDGHGHFTLAGTSGART